MPNSLPPGPRLIQTLGFVRNPYRFLDDCARRFGEWFTVRVPGVPPFVFTSDPAAVREVFLGDPDHLHAGKANRPLGAFMGDKSVLFLDGDAHLHDRRMLLPAFQGERMAAYADAMRSIARAEIARWTTGKPVQVHRAMRSITFEVIMRVVFGLDEGPNAARLREVIGRLFALYTSRVGSLFAASAMRIELGGWSPWGRAVRLSRELEALLYAEFERRRSDSGSDRDDILMLMLRARDEAGKPLSNPVLRDEMLTLLLAGHETTAASLAWAIDLLLTYPEVAARARAEADSAGEYPDPAKLRYIDAVVNETMRLRPVVPNVARELQAPMRIAGKDLPPGVAIAPCIYLVHRRPDLWPNPEKFDPARFIDSRPSPYAFFPFGGGVRRCLGAAFATYQMKLVLAEVLRTVDIAPQPGYSAHPIRSSIAIAPSDGMPAVVMRRLG